MCRIERPWRATRSKQRQSIQAGSHRQRNGQEGTGASHQGRWSRCHLVVRPIGTRLRPGPLVKCHVVRVEQMGPFQPGPVIPGPSPASRTGKTVRRTRTRANRGSSLCGSSWGLARKLTSPAYPRDQRLVAADATGHRMRSSRQATGYWIRGQAPTTRSQPGRRGVCPNKRREHCDDARWTPVRACGHLALQLPTHPNPAL